MTPDAIKFPWERCAEAGLSVYLIEYAKSTKEIYGKVWMSIATNIRLPILFRHPYI